jgi:hypothetical protein
MAETKTITVEPTEAETKDPNLAVLESLRAAQDGRDPESGTEDAEPEDTDSEPEGPSKEDLDKAVAALKRASVPKTLLDQMSKDDPDGLIKWGQKIAEQQRVTDGYGTKVEQLEAELAKERLKTKDTEPGQPDSEPGVLQKLLETVKNEYGDELATPLGKITAHIEKSLAKQAKDAQERLEALEDAQLSAVQRAARPDIESTFPQIQEDSNWSKVTSLAKKLTDSGVSESQESALADAAKMLFADELIEAKATQKKAISKAKANGQPASSARTNTERPATLDGKKINEAVLNKLRKGASVEEAKKWRDQQR